MDFAGASILSIVVQLERFEGPLGLLLHLIREQEMDVFNINVNQITRQYLEYIKTMRRLDLEVAGEFVAMAATLIHLKSRMLLPQYTEEGEEVAVDPRKELVQKLVEYKKFRELSGELYQRPLLGRDVLTRGDREKVAAVGEAELVLADNPLFSLISAYRFTVKNMKKGVHKVASELQSIAARILEMKDFLIIGRRVLFRDLLNKGAEAKGNHVLVTFLSLLELAKMGFVSVFQSEPLGDIHVESKREVDRDVVSTVESYDSVNAAMVADEILTEAALSLDEPSADEDEEPAVGREAMIGGASDDDIEAEERRLFTEEGVTLEVHHPIETNDDPDEVAEFVAAPAMDDGAAVISAAEPDPIAAPAMEAAADQSKDISKQNLDNALAAALSAFDAFDEPATDPNAPPPEVSNE